MLYKMRSNEYVVESYGIAKRRYDAKRICECGMNIEILTNVNKQQNFIFHASFSSL